MAFWNLCVMACVSLTAAGHSSGTFAASSTRTYEIRQHEMCLVKQYDTRLCCRDSWAAWKFWHTTKQPQRDFESTKSLPYFRYKHVISIIKSTCLLEVVSYPK